jgi:hypothetical protein
MKGKIEFVGFEVLTAVVMKTSVFWDITLCRPLKIYECFGEMWDLLSSGLKNK